MNSEKNIARNLYEGHPVDGFECSRCGFRTEEFNEIVIDEDDGEKFFYEFEIRFCPKCGARIVEEDDESLSTR